MKIAQVTPRYEAVPSKLYGGAERVVAHLLDRTAIRARFDLRFSATAMARRTWMFAALCGCGGRQLRRRSRRGGS